MRCNSIKHQIAMIKVSRKTSYHHCERIGQWNRFDADSEQGNFNGTSNIISCTISAEKGWGSCLHGRLCHVGIHTEILYEQLWERDRMQLTLE